jgi:hypothetical protein
MLLTSVSRYGNTITYIVSDFRDLHCNIDILSVCIYQLLTSLYELT